MGGYRNKFELRDPEIETAKILECVFDIIVSNKAFLDFRSVHYQYIIEFMQKYDFERDMEHLRTSLQLAVAERRHLIRAIVAASHLGDIKLCGRIIATAENLVWSISNAREASFGSALQARPLFDIRSWPIEQMESLRPSFFWVLLRASEKRTGLEGRGKEDGKAMSAEFLRLMSLEGEFTPMDRDVFLLTCSRCSQIHVMSVVDGRRR
jgi:hypothetical protein